ncbi:MAG: hypothetical protein ACRD5H_09650 [Nitrososphaerales archaeon]
MKNKGREGRVNEILEDVSKQLGSIKASIDNSTRKNHIWMSYAKLEYAILLAKLDHDFETPGGFEYNKLAKTSDLEMLELIIGYLESGKKALNKGDIRNAINDLRKARDALKLLVLDH